MNHTRIAAEALRYHLNLVRIPLVGDDEWDREQMASRSLTAAGPGIERAIRRTPPPGPEPVRRRPAV